MNPRITIFAASFEQTNPRTTIGTQPVRQHAARRTAADDHVVKM